MASAIGPAKRNLYQLLVDAEGVGGAGIQVAYRLPAGDLRDATLVALGAHVTTNARALIGEMAKKDEAQEIALVVRHYDPEADEEKAAQVEEVTLDVVDAVRSVVHSNPTLRLPGDPRGPVRSAIVARTMSEGPVTPPNPSQPGLFCEVLMTIGLDARSH